VPITVSSPTSSRSSVTPPRSLPPAAGPNQLVADPSASRPTLTAVTTPIAAGIERGRIQAAAESPTAAEPPLTPFTATHRARPPVTVAVNWPSNQLTWPAAHRHLRLRDCDRSGRAAAPGQPARNPAPNQPKQCAKTAAERSQHLQPFMTKSGVLLKPIQLRAVSVNSREPFSCENILLALHLSGKEPSCFKKLPISQIPGSPP